MATYKPLSQQGDADEHGAEGLSLKGARTVSPAQSASLPARLVFSWQTPLFAAGVASKLEPADMDNWPLRERDGCELAAQRLQHAWDSLDARQRGEEWVGGGACEDDAEESAALKSAGVKSMATAAGRPLLRALLRAYGQRLVVAGLWKFTYQAAVFTNVFAIRALLYGLSPGAVDAARAEILNASRSSNTTVTVAGVGLHETELAGVELGVWWTGLLVLLPTMGLCQFVQSVSQHHLWNSSQTLGMVVRSGVTTLIFSKCMRLRVDELGAGATKAKQLGGKGKGGKGKGGSKSSPRAKAAVAADGDENKSTTKDALNLMTSDTERLVNAVPWVHWFWASLLEIVLCLALSGSELGWSALAGFGVMVLVIPVQSRLAHQIAATRRRVVSATDRRVRAMNEILAGMKVIKLFSWEAAFLDRIAGLRNVETEGLLRAAAIKSTNTALAFVLPMLVCFASFSLYQVSGHELSVPKVFSCLALFNVMYRAINMLPMSIEKLAEAHVASERLTEFLNTPEHGSIAYARAAGASAEPLPDGTIAVLVGGGGSGGDRCHNGGGARFRWGGAAAGDSDCLVLPAQPLQIRRGETLMLIGRVGAGKSSLLAGVLGEALCTEGRVLLADSSAPIGYVPQAPWIIAGTIRENILMGVSLDRERYEAVIYACALEEDLAAMPAGDMTEIGERGVNLSGGQKLRVNLARAVYQRDAELLLLDDPLSAVDAHVGAHLLAHCIFGLLQKEGRTVVMATHQLHSLRRASRVLLLDHGRIVADGTADEVATRSQEIGHDLGLRLAEALSGHHSDAAPARQLDLPVDTHANGDVAAGAQPTAEKVPQEAGAANGVAGSTLVMAEDRDAGSVGIETYRAYAQAGGGVRYGLLVVVVSALCQGARIGADVWLAVWADGMDSTAPDSARLFDFQLSPNTYILIYLLLIALVIPLNIGRTFGFTYGTVRSARSLHNHMFGQVLAAPLTFFETNPLGRILNRFASDMDSIDTMLPWSALAAFQIFFIACGAIVACAASLPPILIVLPVLFAVFRRVQKMYLATSREIKRIEAVSKSPLYALFSVTLPGLAPIRAAKLQQHFTRQFLDNLDQYHRPHFLFLAGSRWVGIRLDLISNVIVLSVCLCVVVLRGSISPALAGVVLTQSMQLTGVLQFGIRQTAEVENLMTSVQRIRAYGRLPSEENAADEARERRDSQVGARDVGGAAAPPPPGWPSRGRLVISELRLRYRPGLPLAADGVSFTCEGGSRVGVIGRTGAGKSTLLTALFRLVEPESGTITIDGVDICGLPLASLRRAISIIPQDPLLFSGPLRANLDPNGDYTDQELLETLLRCNMRDAVLGNVPHWSPARSTRGVSEAAAKAAAEAGLDAALSAEVGDGGSSWSVGERQLLCLARAMLRRARVLCLDEATAAVDMHTDARIQNVVREETLQHGTTLLTIAHRLHTVIDYDQIIEMAAGKCVGCGSAHELLGTPTSLLFSLVGEMDEETARQLRSVAKEANEAASYGSQRRESRSSTPLRARGSADEYM
jgi:ABC-type multidrug transport system fused ATPase/permease subunit